MLVIVGKVSVYIVLIVICAINVNQCVFAINAFSYSTATEEQPPQKERDTSMIAVIAILTVVVAIAGVFLSSVAS